MSEAPKTAIKEPGEEHDQHKCDCLERDRWRQLSKVLGAACAFLMVGCVVMGWTLSSRARTIDILEERLQTTPADVLAKLSVTPADVLLRVEKLERDLTIKPVDVLREVQALREDIRSLQEHVSGEKP